LWAYFSTNSASLTVFVVNGDKTVVVNTYYVLWAVIKTEQAAAALLNVVYRLKSSPQPGFTCRTF